MAGPDFSRLKIRINRVRRFRSNGTYIPPSQRLIPRPPKFLRRDDRKLPIPSVNILAREMKPCRLEDYYHSTLRDDVMYMNYVHETKERGPPREVRLTHDPANPFTKFRSNPPIGGVQLGRKPPPPTTSDNVVRLEKISLHSMQKAALGNRASLLGTIMAFRAISGLNKEGGGWRSCEGVQIVRGKKNVSGWVRPGVPIGVKVDIQGEKMYDFIANLVNFVLPRLRDFEGLRLPAPSTNMNIPSGVSGVISMGLPPEAMAFFPEIEVNQDAYPKNYGMHIHFITSAEGVGAHQKARSLLSGFQLPFVRR